MQKSSLNVFYAGENLLGFEFANLPVGAALLVAAQQIEQAADQARASVLVDPLRAVELQMAEADAKAYKLAGFDGEVPATVQAVVDASEVEPQAAAELILAESATWRGLLCEIRAARLKGKQAMLKATTHDEAERFADTAINAIRAISKAAA
ncbi:hypothetical protein E4195_11685 [Pseudomonas putida]|uniref:hypothetical protein n=1 Tax=Pseudomonas putida group TaxID=136845 RepID=UPI001074BED7|nr:MULTISPECIES: hypothetical protein [Pseudomonas putida group]MBZ3664908.1 hypothetical protein [Pseudomonas monteilii]MBZ3670253.1 hypothetical protein [Pseudomonas monteilii]TFW37609.1 hypothetical protein E4195_11685 [Pseudomonas putida]